jgi:hypothetical protein
MDESAWKHQLGRLSLLFKPIIQEFDETSCRAHYPVANCSITVNCHGVDTFSWQIDGTAQTYAGNNTAEMFRDDLRNTLMRGFVDNLLQALPGSTDNPAAGRFSCGDQYLVYSDGTCVVGVIPKHLTAEQKSQLAALESFEAFLIYFDPAVL